MSVSVLNACSKNTAIFRVPLPALSLGTRAVLFHGKGEHQEERWRRPKSISEEQHHPSQRLQCSTGPSSSPFPPNGPYCQPIATPIRRLPRGPNSSSGGGSRACKRTATAAGPVTYALLTRSALQRTFCTFSTYPVSSRLHPPTSSRFFPRSHKLSPLEGKTARCVLFVFLL